ncbi:MAG: hypothetical protein ACN6NT_04070, partial [Comamonas sp.]
LPSTDRKTQPFISGAHLTGQLKSKKRASCASQSKPCDMNHIKVLIKPAVQALFFESTVLQALCHKALLPARKYLPKKRIYLLQFLANAIIS